MALLQMALHLKDMEVNGKWPAFVLFTEQGFGVATHWLTRQTRAS